MKRKYLRLFVCRQFLLAILLCLYAITSHAQPACGTVEVGKIKVSDISNLCAGSPITFSLDHNTTDPSIMFFIQRADNLNGPYTPAGPTSLDPANSPINTNAVAGISYYRIAAMCIYNGTFSPFSDTITVQTRPEMSGIYTINSGVTSGGRTFASFTEAVEKLTTSCITGPVVFNVTTTDATYKEQITIPQLRGTSDINTVTFNGNGNTISYNGTGYYDNRHIIKLDGADHIIIDSLKIDATTGQSGIGVALTNDADKNIIRHCTINAGVNSNFSGYMGILISGSADNHDWRGSYCDDNILEGNLITGGSLGIGITGQADRTQVINNDIRDAQLRGISVGVTSQALISGNKISRPKRTVFGNFYAMEFTSDNYGLVIRDNRIFNLSGGDKTNGAMLYGIYFSGCDADAANPNRVFNNLFYNFNSTGQVVALYNGSSDYVSYYHNTISFDNTVTQTSTQPSAGLFLNAEVTGVEFKNNIVSIQRGGAGFKYGIYKRTEAILCNSDYNDLFLLPDASYFVGFAGSGQQSLAAWQTKTGNDLATVLMDPMFLNAKEDNYKPNNQLLDNKGTDVGVTEDFDVIARSSSTPDIGAYEFAHLVCSSPPAAGTITVLQNPVCSAASASLTVSGGELGDGISYQWQSSADGTSWNNIASATAKEAVVTQTADTWYRMVATCGAGSTPSDKVFIQTQYPISGLYTINKAVATGGKNFQSFSEAWNAVKCGITGPVQFNVVPGSGPYVEQLITSPVPGMSAINTITFLGNGNTLEFASDNAFERATVKLNGTDHLIIDSLIIKATASGTGRYAYGVHLTNDADSNIIRRCAIYSDTAMGLFDWGYSAIVVNGPGNINPGFGEANADGNIFEYNTVVGGYYGIVLAGSSSSPNRRNVIRGNQFINFLHSGVNSSFAAQLVIDSNYFSRPTRAGVGVFNGIYLNNNHVASTITRNRIFNGFGGEASSTEDFYGIQLNNADASSGTANIVANNVIYNTNGAGAVYGLYNSSSDYAWYYHNTVHIDGSGSYDACGLYQSGQAVGILFRNNIVTVNRSGDGKKYGMYLATPGTVFISDYNNFFIQSETTNANVAYLAGANRKSVANIQLNGNDAHSTSVDPVYQNLAAGNLQPKNGAIDNTGLPVAVAIDVNGVERDATNPDIGAFEFIAEPCSGAVTAGTAVPSNTEICEGTKMELNLSGNSTGGGQTYQWEASTSATGGFGAVSAAQKTPTYYFTPDVNTIYYRAAVTCNGVTSYTQPVTFSVGAMLPAGIYTIDKNGTGDFKSFNEAKAAMACGIKGPVVFNVLPGGTAYNEQLLLDTIIGASAINTVTFKGNGDTLVYSSEDYDAPAVIAMNKTDYVTFDSLVISAIGTGYYGVGVWVGNQANNNTFRKCTILIPQTSSSSSYNGVIVGSSASSPTSTSYTQDFYNGNNLFENNTIIGGYCGMSMQGSIYGAVANNRFIGNTISDVYSYGIYTAASVYPVIDSNIISRPTRKTIGTFYGIYASGSGSYPVSMNHGLRINGNRIHTSAGGNTASSSAAYGIYFSTTTAATLTPAIVSNNLIYKFNGSGAEYGIYNSNAGNVRYYHNTISLDNKTFAGTTAAYGIYMSSAASNVDVRNNIVSVSRSGTGVRYAMYFPSSASFISDFNNIWVEPGTNRSVGYFGGAKKTLADWQGIANSNTDKNSVSMYPAYADTANGKYNSTLTELDNTGTPVGVTADIYKAVRSTTTPDLGAYESSAAPCTAPPVAGTSAITPATLSCMGGTVTLTLTGNSTGGSQKYVWQRAALAAGPWVNITDSLSLPDYVYQVNEKQAYFRAAVVCGTGITYSDAVALTVTGGLDAGDYTIDPSLPSGNRNFLSFNEAVSAMLCGINGSVRVLVAPGFYEERVRVPAIPGTGAGTTVTFQSRDNAAASVVLTDSCTIDSNYVVKLDTTSFIIFKNITIKPIGADYARAVVITGGSANDSITGCTIPLPAVQNTSDNVVGIYGKELLGNRLVVTKNTISNGMAGVYLEGAEPFAQDFVVDSNNVSGGYWYSIYARNLIRVSVSGNTITRSGIQNVYGYGIHLQKCDSATRVDKNKITITGTATSGAAIQVFLNTGGIDARGSISGNIIHADASNTGDIYGVRAYTSAANFTAMNNVVVIATSGNGYGIYSVGASGGVNYYNNSVLIESQSPASTAAFIGDGNDRNGGTGLYNNVLANTGGGLAMRMFNSNANRSDYNMYYSSGADLISTASGNVATLKEWQDRSNWDYSSIVYKPSFADNITLKPDVAKPEVWAMHGRGAQITEDSVDINGTKRPVTFETGVPDLGAYEFTPATTPVALTAIPVVPEPNKVQTFMLGTDTVTQITWGSIVPTAVEGKRYSGVSPEGLQPNQPFMYFYTNFTYTGTAPKDFGVKQFYVNSWRGLIPKENMIKLGKSNTSSGWDISSRSRLDTVANSIADIGIGLLAKFTGLTDGKEAPTNPVVIGFRDSSNRGTMFWVPYANTQSFYSNNDQDMMLYLGAGEKEAHVTIRVNGTSWMKRYTVPAFGAITTDAIPKSGLFDARLLKEGWSERGISIQSDVPVAAYAHIYNRFISGATMLMPVGTYGYEYYALTGRQTNNTTGLNYSVASVVAAYDSTVVEITPSVKTQGNRPAGVPFTVILMKGETYQLMGAIDNIVGEAYDLTGTKFRSVKNENGKCWPIAVFSGSSLTGFDCSLTGNGGTGDNLFQQNFPYQAWGKRYLTAPLSHHNDAKTPQISLYRVSVKDPAAVVLLNGNPLTNLVNNSYYEFASNTADYITSDKPVMVAQFEISAMVPHCGNTEDIGDPEMFFLSSIEQGVKETQLYRNTSARIDVQYLTMVVPTKGLQSLMIDGVHSWDYDYPHPNMPGYSVVVVRWVAERKQAFVKCDSAFTGVTYGMGQFESYGYNAGTNVFNLNTRVVLNNTHTQGGNGNDYTCAGTPFNLSLFTTVQPTAIDWELSKVPHIKPAGDVHVNSPKAADTMVINGVTYYKYVLEQEVSVDTVGEFYISAFITHPDIDACDSRQETRFPVTVVGAPVVNFVSVGSCAGSEVQFAGSAELESGAAVTGWTWDFNDAGAGSHEKDTVHTYKQAGDYNVQLSVVYANGCIGDTVKVVNIKAPLPAPVVKKGVITAFTVQFTWDAVAGATGYEVSMDNGVTWVTPSTGNEGLSHTVTGLQLAQTVTIKVRVLGSCMPAESAPLSATTMVQEVFIPNSFSPDNNGPAENEYFRIYGNSIKQLRLLIFNQWGEKVFESNNQMNGWDGRYKGKPQPSGVYIYVADVLMENGTRETKKGTINLIR